MMSPAWRRAEKIRALLKALGNPRLAAVIFSFL
jgi:hypothetical protein